MPQKESFPARAVLLKVYRLWGRMLHSGGGGLWAEAETLESLKPFTLNPKPYTLYPKP